MFATLLMEEARTQARRNTGVAGIMALVAMPAVVSIQIGIAALASAAVATLLVAGWFASFAHLPGVTLEQVLEPVRQMVSLVGIGSVVVAPILAAILVWWRCEPLRAHLPALNAADRSRCQDARGAVTTPWPRASLRLRSWERPRRRRRRRRRHSRPGSPGRFPGCGRPGGAGCPPGRG